MKLTSCHAALLVVWPPLCSPRSRPRLSSTTAAEAPTRDTSYIDADGTARITRVVPVPADLSSEARRSLSRAEPDQAPPEPLVLRRSRTDAWAATSQSCMEQDLPPTR